MFTFSQIKTTIRPNTFSSQDAGIYSNAEIDQSWNRILFSKHSDSTLQLLVKLLVTLSSHLILLITMQILLTIINTKHYVMDYMINQ